MLGLSSLNREVGPTYRAMWFWRGVPHSPMCSILATGQGGGAAGGQSAAVFFAGDSPCLNTTSLLRPPADPWYPPDRLDWHRGSRHDYVKAGRAAVIHAVRDGTKGDRVDMPATRRADLQRGHAPRGMGHPRRQGREGTGAERASLRRFRRQRSLGVAADHRQGDPQRTPTASGPNGS